LVILSVTSCHFTATDISCKCCDTNVLRIISKLSKSKFDVYKRNSCRPGIILAERHYDTIHSV
ncbi:MAG: hypothetical protein QGI15_03885, partial [Candidatus Scalindua sp.]|nr:hypothetical protein [Candidatus Scalindua sp.]